MEQHNLRENVAQIVLLRHLHHPQQPQLLLSNTHTLFNPKRGEVKLGQARVLTSEIAAALEDAGTSHQGPLGVVMCGDYNTLPGSALYRFWAHGSVDCTSVDRRDLAGQVRHAAFLWCRLLFNFVVIWMCNRRHTAVVLLPTLC